MMTHQNVNPISTIDPYKSLQLILNADGTLTRHMNQLPNSPSSLPDHLLNPNSSPVLYKDVPLNQSKSTSLRLFLPREALDNYHSSTTTSPKLPIILYFHGGGFILFTPATVGFHIFCSNMASHLPAIVVSVDHRLAPENRLPAAYDDAMDALHWIKTTTDDWLTNYADVSNCYIMGSSSGGNIAYHTGLRVVDSSIQIFEPLVIKGLILHHPFFGSVQRTKSQIRLVDDVVLPLPVTDLMWKLSLPNGADRDHEYCNPTAGDGSTILEKIGQLGWRVMVIGCDGDPLYDGQFGVAKLMEEKGVTVINHFEEGGYHIFNVFDPSNSKADSFLHAIKRFVSFSYT